jgi:hypothetical protein
MKFAANRGLQARIDGKPIYGVNCSQATPYPGSVTWIRVPGVPRLTGVGALAALEAASIVSRLDELKVARFRFERSTITVRGEPLPLLSDGDATARSTIITVKTPAEFSVASVSTVEVSVAVKASIFGPGAVGVEG